MNDRLRSQGAKSQDTIFLQDQRSERKLVLGSIDRTYSKRVEKRQEKIIRTEQLKEKNSPNVAEDEQHTQIDDDEPKIGELEPRPSTSSDPDYVFEQRKSKKLRILDSPKVSNIGDRLKLSVRQKTAYSAVVAAECGVDL